MTKSMIALQRIVDLGGDGVAYLQLKAFIEMMDGIDDDGDVEAVKDALDIVGR